MIDWTQVELPDSWPDLVPWRHPRYWPLLWSKLRGKHGDRRVRLPPELPGRESLPPYLLLEFHNLPNGYYSRHISHGYSKGFDISMLGTLQQGRRRIAHDLRNARCALDVGAGSGHLAGAMVEAGIPEVWGLEPSPYLLRIAASTYPCVAWRQGTGEDSKLADAQFDAVGICFVLHEIPPAYIDELLAELRRITQPRAQLVALEPSPLQWQNSTWTMWKAHGWRGAYFRTLAKRVYEPYLEAWHDLDFQALLNKHGFAVLKDEVGCPYRYILAERNDGGL